MQNDGGLQRFSIWIFLEQCASVNNHLLCYWPTIHNSILKIWPKFQVLSFHFFEVDELLNEPWKWNYFDSQYDKVYRSKVCVQEFSDISCLALIFNLSNPRLTILSAKKAVTGCETLWVIYCFFVCIDTNPWLSGYEESQWVWRRGFYSSECWKSLQPLCHLALHWHAQFHIAARSTFVFLDFVSGYLALTEY